MITRDDTNAPKQIPSPGINKNEGFEKYFVGK